MIAQTGIGPHIPVNPDIHARRVAYSAMYSLWCSSPEGTTQACSACASIAFLNAARRPESVS